MEPAVCGGSDRARLRPGYADPARIQYLPRRVHPRNCHAQLKQCNRRGWDLASYRANLIGRIGLEAVEALEQDNRTHKWTRDELREIRDTYRQKLRELLKARRS